MTTHTLPTDRHGRVYYGPKTYQASEEFILDAVNQGESQSAVAEETAEMLEGAGYPGVARRVRREFNLDIATA